MGSYHCLLRLWQESVKHLCKVELKSGKTEGYFIQGLSLPILSGKIVLESIIHPYYLDIMQYALADVTWISRMTELNKIRQSHPCQLK